MYQKKSKKNVWQLLENILQNPTLPDCSRGKIFHDPLKAGHGAY